MDKELPPPWTVEPNWPADCNQGIGEAYVTLNWLPFWQSLTDDQKARYLEHWHATDWQREQLAMLYNGEGINWKEEAVYAERAREQYLRTKVANRTLWQRIKRWLTGSAA